MKKLGARCGAVYTPCTMPSVQVTAHRMRQINETGLKRHFQALNVGILHALFREHIAKSMTEHRSPSKNLIKSNDEY